MAKNFFGIYLEILCPRRTVQLDHHPNMSARTLCHFCFVYLGLEHHIVLENVTAKNNLFHLS